MYDRILNMRLEHISSRPLRSSSFIAYLRFIVRIANWAAMSLPALAVMEIFASPLSGEAGQAFANIAALNGLVGLLVFQVSGLYGEDMFSSRFYLRRILNAWLITFSLIVFFEIALKPESNLSAWGWVVWFSASFFLLALERMLLLGLFKTLTRNGFHLQNTAIIGFNDNGIRLAKYFQENSDIRSGLVGFVDDRNKERLPALDTNLPLLGDINRLVQLVREDKVQQILVSLPWSAVSRMDKLTNELKRLPVNVLLAPDMQAFRYAHNRVKHVAGLPMFNIADIPLSGWSPIIKRLEDIILSSIALIAVSPLMLVTAILIRLESPGPVLFKQKRYGYNNKLIEVYKFRSMWQSMTDAHAEQQTTKNDKRVTRVGRVIRRLSIDELPQLFNVLLGNMSIVGPRPHACATKAAGVLFEDAVAEYTSRHRVKPGITGWAQINKYRGETDTLEKIEKRVEYDLEYIEAWSVWLDLYIIFMTVPSLVFSKESY
jgi:Undecaprenyl-phosphate glucose phosphotransferase